MPAIAQDQKPTVMSATERWSGSLELSAAPRFGQARPFDSNTDIVDESEGGVAVAVKRKGDWGLTNFELKAGVTTSPQLLDDRDPSSGIYTQVSLGDAEIPVYWQIDPTLPEYQAEHLRPDFVRPFVTYRWTERFDDFLQQRSRDDHRVAVGIRYRDIRAVMRAADKLTDTAGTYWEAQGEVSQTWSTNSTKEMLSPSISVTAASRPLLGNYKLLGGTRLFGKAQVEWMFYDSSRAPDGRKREDQRLRLTAGFDLTGWTKRITKALQATVAGQYQKQWSNDPTARSSRWYFIPSLILKTDL